MVKTRKQPAKKKVIRGAERHVARRRKRMVGNIARNWREAEEWDRRFWFEQTPEMRIRAMEELRREWRIILHARQNARHKGIP